MNENVSILCPLINSILTYENNKQLVKNFESHSVHLMQEVILFFTVKVQMEIVGCEEPKHLKSGQAVPEKPTNILSCCTDLQPCKS